MIKATVFPAEEWLFPDSSGGEDSIAVSCPSNSFACWQMVIHAKGTVRISADNLDGLQIYRLLPVTVNRNSAFIEELDTEHTLLEDLPRYYIKKAPFEVYDAMLPLKDMSVLADGDTALYFKWPSGQKAGNHLGEIRLTMANEHCLIPYQIQVFSAAVPEKGRFNMINWIEMNPKKYGCTAFSQEYWEKLTEILKLARMARQNFCNVSANYFQCSFDGRYRFDFSRVEKFLSICFSLGFDKIEGPSLKQIYEGLMMPFEEKEFGTPECIPPIEQFLEQWYQFLKQNHYEGITYQHIYDEPREKNVAFYRKLGESVHRHMPEIPTLDAVLSLHTEDAADILIPTTRFYQLHKDVFEQYRKNGKKLWLYTCCWPSAPYLNRFLDMPLLDVRLIHWLNFLTDCDGYLHWGFCFHPDVQDQWKEPSIPFKIFDDSLEQYLPPGDTNIIYPYQGKPLGSVRLEMQRAGVEDFELLSQISDRERALQIVRKCINKDFTGNRPLFREAYLELLDCLSEI